MPEHPFEIDLLRWLDRDLEPEELSNVLLHVNHCEECRGYLQTEGNLGALLGALEGPGEKE